MATYTHGYYKDGFTVKPVMVLLGRPRRIRKRLIQPFGTLVSREDGTTYRTPVATDLWDVKNGRITFDGHQVYATAEEAENA